MKNYQLSAEIIALFNDTLEIGDSIPFFCTTIYPKSKAINFQGHYSENGQLVSKIKEIYKPKMDVDTNGYLYFYFNINNWEIQTIFC